MNASIPLVSLAGGPLLIPADRVTGLLRRLAAGWLASTDAGETDLDPGTVLALAGVLSDVADQIDAECIAFLPVRGEGGGTSPP
ncbi:DUF6213 family protein [Streptomyces vilmorinianum]|uniref:DUF6213 family protein n=1 Tax=Streptomyces vilmorinianum TaxID=3051092 RepID=UPI0010FB941A|nr:DUF6213 family protein [Streptomyces vilmorinianum]